VPERLPDSEVESGTVEVLAFSAHIGHENAVLPKLHARILRFEAALDSRARFPGRSWTDVAHAFGYYDQMHMIHDFQRFTGDTPSKILRELEDVAIRGVGCGG
jgi:AraC-like DNA-binding protein